MGALSWLAAFDRRTVEGQERGHGGRVAKAGLGSRVNAAFTTSGPEVALAPAYAGRDRAWLGAALALDARLAGLALRPGDAALARLRILWWEEAVGALAAGSDGVDPLLVRLRPGLVADPTRTGRVTALTVAWDRRIGTDPASADMETLAAARAALLLDGREHAEAARALAGRALLGDPAADTGRAETWLAEGLRRRWPRALRAHRLLARAALMRLEGRSERWIAARLIGLALTGG